MTENKHFEFKLCPNGYHYLYFGNDLYITPQGDYVILEQSGDVAELLDTSYSENQKLLRDCDNLIDDNTELVVELNQDSKKLKEVLEENEQLKKENQELRKYLGWQDMELEEMRDLND